MTMDDYIKRSQIKYSYTPKRFAEHSELCRAYNDGVKSMEIHIAEIPTADVVEVRHGVWLPSRNGINPIRCDKCNMPALFVQEQDGFGGFGFYRCPSNYCPNCGADMRGDKNG